MEEYVDIELDIPLELFKRIEAISQREKITVQEFIIQAIEAYLSMK